MRRLHLAINNDPISFPGIYMARAIVELGSPRRWAILKQVRNGLRLQPPCVLPIRVVFKGAKSCSASRRATSRRRSWASLTAFNLVAATAAVPSLRTSSRASTETAWRTEYIRPAAPNDAKADQHGLREDCHKRRWLAVDNYPAECRDENIATAFHRDASNLDAIYAQLCRPSTFAPFARPLREARVQQKESSALQCRVERLLPISRADAQRKRQAASWHLAIRGNETLHVNGSGKRRDPADRLWIFTRLNNKQL